jgi:uncharacterized protein with NAD-binding domain and iron-sulfur cluster
LNFTDAAKRSKLFYRFFGVGMTRCMVACRADLVSARTAGTILLQLLFCMSSPFNQVDRLLCGPTNEVWIDPWEAYLKGRGVKFHPDSEATAFSYSGNHVDNLTIQHNQTATSETVSADYYISAVPVEVMQGLIASLKTADPNLSLIANLKTAWMNGIQFYLRHTLPVAQGHTIYLDSPWALTSIPQDKFWSRNVRHSYGNGKVSAILSVDISNWDEKGNNGKSAKECTADEIKDEVWLQMEQHLNKIKQPPILQTSNIMDWQLDPDIVFPGCAGNTTGKTENREPLLINTVGSLASRPEATTGIDNLFLASDYVRTYTDLATMEGANEAARRAVNGILDATNSSQSPCDVWPLSEPDFLVPFRVTDEVLFAMGQKNMFDVTYHQLTQNAVATTLKKIQSQVVGPYGPVLQALFNAAMNQLLQAI